MKIKVEELHKQVNELAKEFGQTYFNANVGMYNDSVNDTFVVLKAYINDIGLVEGDTIEDVISKLRALKKPKYTEIKD